MLNRILPVLFASVFIGSAFSSKAASSVASPDTIYVDTLAIGLNDGTSWADAYTNLQQAISAQPANKIFLVAKGTYFPGLPGDPSATFSLKDGQQIWGGFPTGGADFSLRNAKTNVTILSGDLNNNGTAQDGVDARTIITLNSLSFALVDGFTISGAINNGGIGGGIRILNSTVTISNNIIENNQANDGAGLYSANLSVTAPNIAKNLIRQNTSLNNGKGGGLYLSGEIHVRNNVITGNSSFFGGGVFVTESSRDANLVNNTIVANLSPPAPSDPLADTCPSFSTILFQNLGGRMQLYNNIIWNTPNSPISETNETELKQGTVYTDPTPGTILYNIVPNSSLNNTNGNKVVDPNLNADLSPTKCSPAVEQGLTALLYQGAYNDSTDYLGNKRLLDGNFDGTIVLDLGAMESQLICEPCTTSAGNDSSVCALSFTMRAKKPGYERSGKWTQISGPGVTTYDYDTLETAAISVSVQGTYTYRWTLTGSDCSISDDVVIRYYQQPTAFAGRDTSVCGKLVTGVAVTSTGTGVWSSIETGVSFVNNTEDTTLVSVTNFGVYHLIWTERNGVCPNSEDTVVFVAYQQNVANAGADFNSCQFDGDLKALPHIGSGSWSFVSGPGTAAFTSPSIATSHVTVSNTGTYVFRWTETNGVCPSSSDLVSVNFKVQSIADAGPDIDTCGNIAFMDARPSVGTGVWTLVSGSGAAAFNQNNFAKTKVTFSDIGQYVLRWTETNTPCPSSTDDVVINLAASSIVGLETITDKYCGSTDEILVGVRINGVPPFTFVMEAQHFRDTITTNNSYYIFTDENTFKEQSQLNFRIVSFVDGRDCGAIFSNNLVVVPRIGEDLAPIGNGFSTSTALLCTSNSAILNLNYSNPDDMNFVIEDVAKGSTFVVNYQGGSVSVPVNNLRYGNNLFRITGATKTVGGCPMILNGITELNIVYKPVLFTASVQNLTCFESNDGSIILNIDHPDDLAEITLNSIPNAQLMSTGSLFNLSAANYSIRVTNNEGCSLNRNITITQPPKITYTYTVVNPTCYGLTNGNVNIQVSGGSGSMAIRFGNVTENAPFKFLNLGKGVYPVKITDKNTGCILFADSVHIDQPDSLAVNTLSVDANCDGTAYGNMTLNVSGGTQPYTAQITSGAYNLTLSSFTTQQYVSQLQAGVYSVKVFDNKGCSRIFKDTIDVGTELAYKAVKVKDADCQSPGVIEVTEPSTEPGVLYSIDGINFDTETTFENLTPGTYFVTAKALNGCINRKEFVIADKNQPLNALAIVLNQPICYNGKDGIVQLKITGGSGRYAIIVDGGAAVTDTIIDSLASGTHNIVVIDLNCALVVSISQTLANPSDFTSAVILSRKPTCSYSHDGILRLKSNSANQGITQYSIDGGANYQYSDIFTNLVGGTYQVRCKDAKGCESQVAEFQLPKPDSLEISVNFTNDFSNRTADITISANGGTPPYLYSLNGTNFVPNNVFLDIPFSYVTAYVSDSLGCRNQKDLALGDVGIDILEGNSNLLIYPNPTEGKLYLSGEDASKVTEITVYSLLGEKLMISKPQADKTIDLSLLKTGYYLMVVSTKDSNTLHRIEILK